MFVKSIFNAEFTRLKNSIELKETFATYTCSLLISRVLVICLKKVVNKLYIYNIDKKKVSSLMRQNFPDLYL